MYIVGASIFVSVLTRNCVTRWLLPDCYNYAITVTDYISRACVNTRPASRNSLFAGALKAHVKCALRHRTRDTFSKATNTRSVGFSVE